MQAVTRKKRISAVDLRARFPAIARGLALFLFFGGAIFVGVSYYKMRNNTPFRLKSEAPALSKEITGIIDGYERRITKDNRLYLWLRAARDISYADGHHELETVNLQVFPPAGDKPESDHFRSGNLRLLLFLLLGAPAILLVGCLVGGFGITYLSGADLKLEERVAYGTVLGAMAVAATTFMISMLVRDVTAVTALLGLVIALAVWGWGHDRRAGPARVGSRGRRDALVEIAAERRSSVAVGCCRPCLRGLDAAFPQPGVCVQAGRPLRGLREHLG